ncbi:magnesium transporter [Nitzschia inconspicua]|uniref:Magnesium transporter n=1 Tax=Nitzschia inconspicua TaxID=303405 RepID=A0A9K3KCA8_9STRA|nr:magnesium transporter [Nitzschia inconspicua]
MQIIQQQQRLVLMLICKPNIDRKTNQKIRNRSNRLSSWNPPSISFTCPKWITVTSTNNRTTKVMLMVLLYLHANVVLSFPSPWNQMRRSPYSTTTTTTGTTVLPGCDKSTNSFPSRHLFIVSESSSRRSLNASPTTSNGNSSDNDDDDETEFSIPDALHDTSIATTTTSSTHPTTKSLNVNGNVADEKSWLLQAENFVLRETIRKLEEENQQLKLQQQQRQQRQKLVLENFEGERFFWEPEPAKVDEIKDNIDNNNNKSNTPPFLGLTLTGEAMSGEILEQDDLWCDSLDGENDDGTCPFEPSISFTEALKDRAYWLVGLLILQSVSGVILSRNEALLSNHPVVVYFLTMLVGAGGNAGNQASVRVVRGLALGTLNDRTRNQFLLREIKMAGSLSLILSVAGFLRAVLFKTPLAEAITVTAALALIVFSSICLGAILPIVLERMGVDPAHSSTTIQVIMDILGVVLAVVVSRAILDGPLGLFITSKLGLL